MPAHRWIVVADSPFLPADGGGEREHLGFLTAAVEAGLVAVIVVPSREDLDLPLYAASFPGVPIVVTPRRTSALRLLHPRYPYVVASRPTPAWLVERIRGLAPDATGVVTFSYKSWRIGASLATELLLPMVLRQHNREGDYHRSLQRGSTGLRKLVMWWEANRVARDEGRLDRAPWLCAIADISLTDAEARRAVGAPRVIHVPPFAPLMLEGGDAGRMPVTPPRVVFLGALDVPTNTTALDWLLREVWPRVAAAEVDAALDVVGRAPSDTVRAQIAELAGVFLHADVPSVRPYLDRASVAVNPAVSGSGVNIKVVDYLSAGLPLVSTSLATRGLPLRAGIDLEVRDDAASFAAAIVGLLREPVRAEHLGLTGRRHIRELLDPAANLRRLSDAFDAYAQESARS